MADEIRLRKRSPIVDEIQSAYGLQRRVLALGMAGATALQEGRRLEISRFEELADEIAECALRNPNALLFCSAACDEDAYVHSMGTASLMVLMSIHLGLSEGEIRHAGVAGLLHDVGNFGISSQLLDKPGPLTPGEFRTVAKHSVLGDTALAKADCRQADIRDAVRHHHERLDGEGYPDGIGEREIPRMTRIAALVDAFDAVVRERPYHKALAPAKAFELLRSMAPGKFDVGLLDSLAECVGPFPAGSLVRLSSHRLAVVIEQRRESPQAPLVEIIYDVPTRRTLAPEPLDLLLLRDERVVSAENPGDWHINLPRQIRTFPGLSPANSSA